MKRPMYWLSSVALFVLLGPACSDGDDDGGFTPNGGRGGNGNGGTAGIIINPGTGGALGDGGPTGGTGGGFPLGPDGFPIGFTKADIGGWKLGARVTSGSAGSGSGGSAGSGTTGCGSVLTGVVRDFKRGDQGGGHPDFQTFEGDGLKGIVEDALGEDKKPTYVGTGPHIDAADDNQQHTTTPANFRQWYISNDDINQTFLLHLFLVRQMDGKYTFESDNFFPLDGAGFGDEGLDNGETPPVLHNYLFTTELHTAFRYKGGETFRFEGDDDLWVFINGRLAIDLGGMHSELEETITLDGAAGRLGITVGNVYSLELFHAERRRVHSHFRIDTNLEFVNCGTVIQDPPE